MRFLIDHACAVVDTVSLGPSLLAVSLAVGSMAIPLGLAAAAEPKKETAIFAGGCFWGMEHILREIPGVLATEVGYTGGKFPNPTYQQICTGLTGHAEAVKITYDPEVVSYETLIDYFFRMHDPTTPNRQGNDRGTSYRSGIYYTSETQHQVALDTIADVEASGLWPGKVVTEVKPAGPFWQAEPEHQDYLLHHPGGYTCHFARPGWKLPRRETARG